jgi:hypothetical protein
MSVMVRRLLSGRVSCILLIIIRWTDWDQGQNIVRLPAIDSFHPETERGVRGRLVSRRAVLGGVRTPSDTSAPRRNSASSDLPAAGRVVGLDLLVLRERRCSDDERAIKCQSSRLGHFVVRVADDQVQPTRREIVIHLIPSIRIQKVMDPGG